jgi:predicted enzyme related to lactoylglutathione lyase
MPLTYLNADYRLPLEQDHQEACEHTEIMSQSPVLRMVDAVTVTVPDLDQGLEFYRDRLGHDLLWRNDELGQAGLRLPDSETELVLSTNLQYAPNWLVTSVQDAVADIVAAGGAVLVEPREIPVGRLAVVADPFGNALILLDLSVGRYTTDATGRVTAVDPGSRRDRR